MPAPKPKEASAKTRARSARVRPSRRSSGWRNTLNAYSEPRGRLSAVAGPGRTSVSLTLAAESILRSRHASRTRLPPPAPELGRSRGRDRFLRPPVPPLHAGALGRPARAGGTERRPGALHTRDHA